MDPLLAARLRAVERLRSLRLRGRTADRGRPERPGEPGPRARGIHVGRRRQALERHCRKRHTGRRLRKNGRGTGRDLDRTTFVRASGSGSKTEIAQRGSPESRSCA